MGKALIVGAGAIGRGFVPWTLDGFELDFLDSSEELALGIRGQGGYTSWRSRNGRLERKWVSPGQITSDPSDLDMSSYDLAFVSVGPRNTKKLSPNLGNLECPIFSLENDPLSVAEISARLNRRNVYFGVPDVITSSSASSENILLDPYSIHTENGKLYLELGSGVSSSLREKLPSVEWADLETMKKEWDAKLFLHNTPHCVAAYLGAQLGRTYVHEGFTNSFLTDVVEGVISEMLMALKLYTDHDHYFLEGYANKELRRFSNELLFDPIARVAREPLRKLMPGGRLTGGLTLALLTGVRPEYLQLGIVAALNYPSNRDQDHHALSLRHYWDLPDFLRYHLGLENQSMESRYICSNYEAGYHYIESRLT